MNPNRSLCFTTALLLVLVIADATSASGDHEVRPVRIGTHEQPDLDACLGSGTVAAGDPVIVRTRPEADAPRMDELAADTWIHLCDDSDDGAWSGVVYPTKPDEDCGVGSPVAEPKAYDGPCKSGWIPNDRVTHQAG